VSVGQPQQIAAVGCRAEIGAEATVTVVSAQPTPFTVAGSNNITSIENYKKVDMPSSVGRPPGR
jgi:hypothetical protein